MKNKDYMRLLSIALIAVLIGVCLLSQSGAIRSIEAIWLDFRWSYWSNAGAVMERGGENLYTNHTSEVGLAPWIYPPQLAVFFGALHKLPYTTGLIIWLSILFVSAAWSVYVACRLMQSKIHGYTWPFAAVVALVLFGAFYTDVRLANVNSLVVAAMITGIWLIERQAKLSGGVLIVTAAFMKVLPIVLVVWLVANKQWRACAGVVLGAVVLLHVPMLSTVPAHGLSDGYIRAMHLHVEYVEELVAPSIANQEAKVGGDIFERNMSLNAVMMRLFTDKEFGLAFWPDIPTQGPLLTALPVPLVKGLAAGLALLMFSVGVFVAWKRSNGTTQARVMSAGLVFVPAMLGNLTCWQYHLMAVLLIVAPLTASVFRSANAHDRNVALVAIILLFFSTTICLRHEAQMLRIYGVQTLALVAAWTVSVYLLVRLRPDK